MYRLRTLRQTVGSALLLGMVVGCGSGKISDLSADVDGDPLAPSDTVGTPDSLLPRDSVPTPDPVPNPDTLPNPPDSGPVDPATTPPDSVPRPDSVPDGLDTLPDPDTLPPPNHRGVSFGPFGLWQPNTSIDARLGPFTGSHNYSHPDSLVRQIRIARLRHHRLILNMTGGPSAGYTTGGKFDLAKWKTRMNRFNNTAVKRAVAAGVADGTIIGNSLIDEPETRQWGNVLTKALIDEMAQYVKDIFPTLPVGVDHGPPAVYEWRTSEQYRVIDYVIYQYAWWVTRGDIAAWRDRARELAKRDGVALAFSINVVNGGVQDRTEWDCKGTGGHGSRYPNCQLTTEQLRDWIETLGTDACSVLLWRYHDEFISRKSNQDAFKDIAARLASAPNRSCTRSK